MFSVCSNNYFEVARALRVASDRMNCNFADVLVTSIFLAGFFTGQGIKRKTIMSLCLTMGLRDGPGEDRILGWFSDVRYRDFPCPRQITFVGLVNAVGAAIKERDFCPAQNHDGIYWRERGEFVQVNLIPYAESAGERIVELIPECWRFFNHGRNEDQIANVYAQEVYRDNWRLRIFFNPYMSPGNASGRFDFYLRDVLKKAITNPLIPVWDILENRMPSVYAR